MEGYLDRIEQLVAQGRPVPLSASVMVSKAELEEALAGLRAELPEEMRQSRWVLKERDEVIDQARREAERVVADARAEAEQLVSETEVVSTAQREAERILEEAREEARVLRLEAEDYVDNKLANFEIALHKTLEAVEKGRERLRGRLVSDELTRDEDEPAPGAGDEEPSVPRSQLYDHEGG
ncbi:MAG: DivIVA domain-containing protein [Actinomycetota bacterium]